MSNARWVFRAMPLRSGLATAGKRATISEEQLWEAQNTYPDLDGLVRSRPGVQLYGTQFRKLSGDTTATYRYINATEGDVRVPLPADYFSYALIDLAPLPFVLYNWALFIGDYDAAVEWFGNHDAPLAPIAAQGFGEGQATGLIAGHYTCWVSAVGLEDFDWPESWTYHVDSNGYWQTQELESEATDALSFAGPVIGVYYPSVYWDYSCDVRPYSFTPDMYEVGYTHDPLVLLVERRRQKIRGIYATTWLPDDEDWIQGATTLMEVNGVTADLPPDETFSTTLNMGTHVVSTVGTTFTATIEYTHGVTFYDSNGSTFLAATTAGTCTPEITLLGYRKTFYDSNVGTVNNSTDVRNFQVHTSYASANGDVFGDLVVPTTTNIVFAYPDALQGATKVWLDSDPNTNLIGDCVLTNINVEGADGHAAIAYKVYRYTFTASVTTFDSWYVEI